MLRINNHADAHLIFILTELHPIDHFFSLLDKSSETCIVDGAASIEENHNIHCINTLLSVSASRKPTALAELLAILGVLRGAAAGADGWLGDA